MLSVEKGSDYKLGGLPPVHIGDTYEHRYRIIHKLGQGGFATVWLARDSLQHRYVAIKMIKSSHTKQGKSLEKEILSSLHKDRSSHPGHRYLNLPRGLFQLKSVNGLHDCIVFDLRGPSLLALENSDGYRRLQGRNARVLCKQLLMAISYLHSLRIVHGDVTPGNLLLGLREEIHQCSEQQILDWIGHPDLDTETMDRFRKSGLEHPAVYPRYLVESANLWSFGTMITAEVYLSDFGEAFNVANSPIHHRWGGIPLAYKAPEILFERTQGFAADLWAAACCMHYMRFGYELLDSMGGPKFLIDDMIWWLGNLPLQWSRLYLDKHCNAKLRSQHAQNKNSAGNIEMDPVTHDRLEPETLDDWDKNSIAQPLLVRLRAKNEDLQLVNQAPRCRRSKVKTIDERLCRVQITNDEAMCMATLLGQMLAWNPLHRANPDQLLEHEWFDKSRFIDDDIAATTSQPLLQVDIALRREY